MKPKTLAVRVGAAMLMLAAAQAGAATGPSSSQSPYLQGLAPGYDFTSVLTTGDSIGGYRMSGIPDGLGAFDNGNGTFTVLMNHELGGASGIVRAHGGTGAFVSSWIIDKTTLQVLSGSDLIRSVFQSSASGWTPVSGADLSFNRFCSADLALPSAFYNPATGLGTTERIYLNGEENGNGRGLATIVTGSERGNAYLLPWAAPSAVASQQQSWENLLAAPTSSNKTVVIGNSDGGNNGLVVYVGTKTNTGNAVERAGLTNGLTYRISVNSNAAENRNADAGLGLDAQNKATFTLVGGTGNALADRGAGTSFLRPEDGVWDPRHPNRYYFVTTDRMDAAKDGNTNSDNPAGQVGRTRLWMLTFADMEHPELGGTITMLLDGTGAKGDYQMFDNMTIDANGRIVLLEDVGNNKHLGAIWVYDPETGTLTKVAQHDPARFGSFDKTTGAFVPGSLTKDEESSGVIDITDILGRHDGRIYQLLDVQNHLASNDAELVEGGQLLVMASPVPEPATLSLMAGGLAAVGFMRRRRR